MLQPSCHFLFIETSKKGQEVHWPLDVVMHVASSVIKTYQMHKEMKYLKHFGYCLANLF